MNTMDGTWFAFDLLPRRTDKYLMGFCRCTAYNVASALACLLAVTYGLSIFFDIKDLHTSKMSPRQRT